MFVIVVRLVSPVAAREQGTCHIAPRACGIRMKCCLILPVPCRYYDWIKDKLTSIFLRKTRDLDVQNMLMTLFYKSVDLL